MSTIRTACNVLLIDQFMAGELADERLQHLEDHLSFCELCQSRFNEQLDSLDVTQSIPLLKATSGTEAPRSTKTIQQDVLRNLASKYFPAHADATLLGRIHQFDLVEPLGSGGMGLVYKAYDRSLHRYVAIKVLSPTMATTDRAKQRFVREAKAAAAIQSPYVVPIYAVSEIESLPYIVMQFIAGKNLQELLEQSGPLTIASSLKIAWQIALGLVAAHEQGIIHRDVKPANIMVESSVLKASLTDFGLALVADDVSLTHTGVTLGTPCYMSPEQATSGSVDHRSDWYSLGCVLYAMLVGQPPVQGTNAYEVLSRLQNDVPKKPSELRQELPTWLDQLVMSLLTKDPNHRLANGHEIVELFRSSVMHVENPHVYKLPKKLCHRRLVRSRLWFILIAAVILRVIGGFYFERYAPVASTTTTTDSSAIQEADWKAAVAQSFDPALSNSEIAQNWRRKTREKLQQFMLQEKQEWEKLHELNLQFEQIMLDP